MSPVAAKMIWGVSGNVLTIRLSLRSCGSFFEKKNVSSTFGFRSTVRKNIDTTSAAPAKHTTIGRIATRYRLQSGGPLCEREVLNWLRCPPNVLPDRYPLLFCNIDHRLGNCFCQRFRSLLH